MEKLSEVLEKNLYALNLLYDEKFFKDDYKYGYKLLMVITWLSDFIQEVKRDEIKGNIFIN